MPIPPERPKPKSKPPIPQETKRGGMIDQPGRLTIWTCPVCRRDHHGFSRKVCRNENCSMFGKEASH